MIRPNTFKDPAHIELAKCLGEIRRILHDAHEHVRQGVGGDVTMSSGFLLCTDPTVLMLVN